MQRDRGEQHDERGRARQKAAGEPTASNPRKPSRGSACVVVVVVMVVPVPCARTWSHSLPRDRSTAAPIRSTDTPAARLSHG